MCEKEKQVFTKLRHYIEAFLKVGDVELGHIVKRNVYVVQDKPLNRSSRYSSRYGVTDQIHWQS
ncbi:MAG: hypothetical protein WBI12_12810 [Methanosarcina flavescens]